MGALYDVLTDLSTVHDDELLDGIRRYEEALSAMLMPSRIEAYADHIRREGEIRIFEEMTPNELADLPPELIDVAETVLGDLNLSMENRRVVALLNQRGEHAVAPDLSPNIETADGVLTAPKR
jgi:hypothetical protein